jgi:hypothetical protein
MSIKRGLRFVLGGTIALVLGIIATAVAIQAQDGNNSGEILFTTTPFPTPYPFAPIYSGDDVSLETLHDEGVNVVQPRDLLGNFTLTRVARYPHNAILSDYRNKSGQIIIIRQQPQMNYIIQADSVIQETFIRGRKIVVYDPGGAGTINDRMLAVMHTSDHLFTISGKNLSKDDLLKVAEALLIK